MSQVQILRTTGEREIHDVPHKGRDLSHWIRGRIGADTLDSVNLRDGRMMCVDDNGWETETIRHPTHIEIKPIRAKKPINPEATKLYHSVCVPGTTHQIAGDVAIAWDADFAEPNEECSYGPADKY